MPRSVTRKWVDRNLSVSPRVEIKKLACYQAVWSYLLNGERVKEETDIKFDHSLIFEPNNIRVSSYEDAEKVFLEKIKDCCTVFKDDGMYLIHMRIEPMFDSNGKPSLAIGEQLAYTPFYVVQALIQVGAIIH